MPVQDMGGEHFRVGPFVILKSARYARPKVIFDGKRLNIASALSLARSIHQLEKASPYYNEQFVRERALQKPSP